MKVTVIGRLHFLVSSRSRADVEHVVDLEPQDGIPYFCSCERHNESHHYHGEPCHHILAAVRHVRPNYKDYCPSGPAASDSSAEGAAGSGRSDSTSKVCYTVGPVPPGERRMRRA